MKAFLSLLVLPTFLSPVWAAPFHDNIDASVKERGSLQAPPFAVLDNLLASVQAVDAKINTTMATISADSSPADKAAVEVTINACLEEVIDLLENASSSVSQLHISRKEVRVIKRVVIEFVREISCTLHKVLSVLSLTGTLKLHVKGLLRTLVKTIKPLVGQVNGLLDMVHSLLDSILGGLLGGLLDSVLSIL